MAAGFNEKDTPIKQDNFRRFLRYHMSITKQALVKDRALGYNTKPYLYVDCNAGPGDYAHAGHPEVNGSPLIFLELAPKLHGFEAVFIEKDANEFNRLAANVEPWLSDVLGREVEAVQQDANDALRPCAEDKYRKGLIYHDPNGRPDWGLLQMLAKKFQRVDILVNLNCAAIKRTNGAFEVDDPTLIEGLDSVGKRFLYVTDKTHGKWQWLMALLMNWEYGDWEQEGIVKFSRPQAKQVLHRANYTRRELQPDFFS